MYSIAWKLVKAMPSSTVSARPVTSALRSLCSTPWCAQVTVQPESSRIIVLRKGSDQGSKVWIPFGGQIACSAPETEEHTSELQSHSDLVCRLLLEKKTTTKRH